MGRIGDLGNKVIPTRWGNGTLNKGELFRNVQFSGEIYCNKYRVGQ